MTEVNLMAEGTWDLGDVVAERTQPTKTINVFLNEAASYTKAELTQSLASAKGDEVKAIESTIAEINKELEATKYQVIITAVPSRMREDIHSKALHKVPMRLDMLGRDDPLNAIERMDHENLLIWTAQIVDVINPKGLHKTNWDEVQMDSFIKALPSAVQTRIDESIQKLTKDAERFTVESQGIDF